jgi:hypothetical protein
MRQADTKASGDAHTTRAEGNAGTRQARAAVDHHIQREAETHGSRQADHLPRQRTITPNKKPGTDTDKENGRLKEPVVTPSRDWVAPRLGGVRCGAIHGSVGYRVKIGSMVVLSRFLLGLFAGPSRLLPARPHPG